MTDEKLLEIRKKIEASPQLSDEEFISIMSHQNDEQNIDNLKFEEKNYNILNHIVIDPI
ncbi:MAG: hypothetical protein FWD24_02315 [Treponema sp.]|nr:hypothetical protein [Treponema sp.]